MKEFVEFRLEKMFFAIDIFDVFEIILPPEKVLKIPGGPEYLKGLFDLRGNIIPIVDMRVKLGFSPSELTKKSRVIILKAGRRIAGSLVDEASRILRVKEEEIKPPPSIVQVEKLEYIDKILRIDGKLVLLLNYEKIFEERDIIGLRGLDKKLMTLEKKKDKKIKGLEEKK